MIGDVALIYNNVKLQENANVHFIQALLFKQQYKSEKKLSYFSKTFKSERLDQGRKGGKQ